MSARRHVLVDADQRLDLAAVERRVAGFAALLEARGVGPDRRAVVALRNRAAWPLALFAADRLGAEVIVAPWRSTVDELTHLADDGDAAVVLAEPGSLASAHRLALEIDDSLERAADGGRGPAGAVEGSTPIVRAYTSGTTGRPKAVVPVGGDEAIRLHDEDSLMLRHWGVDGPDQVNLTCAPLHHIAGWGYVSVALSLGQRVVLVDGFDAAEVLRTIERERVTYAWMAPVHFGRIAALSAGDQAVDVSSVRAIVHGAAPCPIDLKRAMFDLFGPVLWETYGGTEGMAALSSPDEWLARPGTVGRAVPELGFEVSVRSPDGEALPPGATGLIYARSPGLRFEYQGAPETTAETWVDDWFTLGDAGYLDDDGFLFLVDRVKDLIISGGSNVYPAEVERVLNEHPAVAASAAIGLPDDDLGERVHAVVVPAVPSAAPAAAELIEHCRRSLVGYKCPRSVSFVDSLPLDQLGKLRRRLLRSDLTSETTCE